VNFVTVPSAGSVEAVIFDVYGTLVEIQDKRRPFRQLLKIGEQQGRALQERDAKLLMSTPMGLQEAAELMGISLMPAELSHLESEMRVEIESIRLFPDTVPTLLALQKLGVKVGLCSNLVAAYAKPVISLLPMQLDAYVWSFEVGDIKPNFAIYARVCESLRCAPADVLMVGDTPTADVEGPQAFGMHGLLVDRQYKLKPHASIPSLLTVLSLI